MASNVENILRSTIDGTEYAGAPQSRVESLLLELKDTIEEGGGGGGDSKPLVKRIQRDIQAPSGNIIYFRANQVYASFSMNMAAWADELEGYTFHSVSIVTPIEDDPTPPDSFVFFTHAYYDSAENYFRSWVCRISEDLDETYGVTKLSLSLLFVKDPE